MTIKTLTLGKNSLLSLYGTLKVTIEPKALYCKKYSKFPTKKELEKCLNCRPNAKTRIICPHLLDLNNSAKPLFDLVKEDTLFFGSTQIDHEFKHKPVKPEFERKQDVWSKTATQLQKLKLAGRILCGEA